jgi:hypothetical protein
MIEGIEFDLREPTAHLPPFKKSPSAQTGFLQKVKVTIGNLRKEWKMKIMRTDDGWQYVVGKFKKYAKGLNTMYLINPMLTRALAMKIEGIQSERLGEHARREGERALREMVFAAGSSVDSRQNFEDNVIPILAASNVPEEIRNQIRHGTLSPAAVSRGPIRSPSEIPEVVVDDQGSNNDLNLTSQSRSQ